MPKPKEAVPKEAVFTLKLEPGLRRAFTATARANDRTASQVVRDLMREYIDRHQRVDEYAAFLSAKVERARAQAAAARCAAAADVEARFASKRCLDAIREPQRMRGKP